MIISVLLLAILVLFVITLIVGYVYVSRTDEHVIKTDEQVDKINATLNKVNASLNNFQKNSNHRWNITFEEFDRVAGAIDRVANKLQDNQVKNLNLTKFNRAALLDTNIIIHKLWENLTGTNPCIDNPLSDCIKVKNITQLVTNYSASSSDIYDPKPITRNK